MMLQTRNDLVRAAKIADEELHAAQKRFEKKIAKFYRDYIARVEALVRRRSTLSGAEKRQAAIAQKIADDMANILADAGLDDLLGDYVDSFPALRRAQLKYFESLGEASDLAGVSRESLSGYIEFTETLISDRLETQLVKPLQEQMFQSLFAGLEREAIVDDLLARTETLTPTQVTTLVHDSFAQYQRVVTNQKADALELEIYIYEGPNDEITSDQCAEILETDLHGVPGAYYKDEISADMLDDIDLRANPLVAGGHPNCRHKFFPVTEEYAKGLGFELRENVGESAE